MLGKQGSKKHGWVPKLLFRLFNMTLNNTYRIYTVLHERQHQQAENGMDQLKVLSMDDAIEAFANSFFITEWLWRTEEIGVSSTSAKEKQQTDME